MYRCLCADKTCTNAFFSLSAQCNDPITDRDTNGCCCANASFDGA